MFVTELKENKRLIMSFKDEQKLKDHFGESLKITKDCKITMKNNNYFLHVPIEINATISNVNFGRVVALDPGERTFQTIYFKGNDCEGFGKFGRWRGFRKFGEWEK